MFSVSEYYKDAITKSKPSYLTGILTFTNGSVREISREDIPAGGASITMQAVTQDILEFGAAVLGQLDLSLNTPRSESRYNYYNATIHLDFNIETANGLEVMPLGDWTVVEADRNCDVLKLSAYDNLFKLDKPYGLSLRASPYDLALKLAEDCGCELAEGLDYYESLPNGIHHLSINANNPCTTYRQAFAVIAQMCGCFVQADRHGRISLRQFSLKETFSLTASQRYNSVISDFTCQYVDLVVTSLAGTFTAVSKTVERGVSMYIDDAPAWDEDSKDAAEAKTAGLLSYLEKIHYTPCELSVFSDPSIDCGDRITLYTDEGVYETIITSYTWVYHNKMDISSVGKNPYLVDSTADKQRAIRDLEQNGSNANVTMLHTFMNLEKFVCTDTLLPIANMSFVATQDTFVIFHAVIQFDVVADDITDTTYLELIGEDGTTTKYAIPYNRDGYVNVSIRYLFNDEWVGPEYTSTFGTGSHILTLYFPITSVAKYSENRFLLYISAGDGGQVTINREMFLGTISGQGLASEVAWDGTLKFTENVSAFAVGIRDTKFAMFSEQIIAEHVTRNDANLSDNINIPVVQTVHFVDVADIIEFGTTNKE